MQVASARFRTAAFAVAALGIAFTLWPARWGGAVSYVATQGASMAPGFRQGDLAIIGKSDTYAVGDVVAYHSALLDTVVLHRIVAIEDGRHTFKGDANDWLDRDEPTDADLVGKLWVRVPGAGRVVAMLRPLALAGALAIILGGRAVVHRRKPRTKTGRPMRPRSAPRSTTHAWRSVIVALTACTAAFAAVGVYALWRPTTQVIPETLTYTHEAAFSYTAVPVPSPVYDDGQVDTGEPVYQRLVDRVEFSVAYDFEAEQPTAVEGTLALRAEIADGTGWEHTVELSPAAAFEGTHGASTGMLDLTELQSVLADVRAATGVATSTYTVDVIADASVTGTIDGQAIEARSAPEMSFHLDERRLLFARGDSGADSFASSSEATVTRPVTTPASVGSAGLAVTITNLRLVGLIGATLAGLGAAAASFLLRRRLPGEAGRIAIRHGRRIVPVRAASAAGTHTIVDVDRVSDLVRLADHHACPILHEHSDGIDDYQIRHDGTVYRYRAGELRHLSAEVNEAGTVAAGRRVGAVHELAGH